MELVESGLTLQGGGSTASPSFARKRTIHAEAQPCQMCEEPPPPAMMCAVWAYATQESGVVLIDMGATSGKEEDELRQRLLGAKALQDDSGKA